jgi:hypothetical protein
MIPSDENEPTGLEQASFPFDVAVVIDTSEPRGKALASNLYDDLCNDGLFDLLTYNISLAYCGSCVKILQNPHVHTQFRFVEQLNKCNHWHIHN